MPPKADYWKYFNVVGVVAYCLIAECKKPNVSLGVDSIAVPLFVNRGTAMLSTWGRFPSRARRSESVSKYDLNYLLVPY